MSKPLSPSKERLLAALADMLKVQAIEDVKITELLTRAHVSHSTFYRVFPTKEDFYAWVLQHYMTGLSATAELNVATPLDYYRHYFAYMSANSIYFRTFSNSSIWPEFHHELYQIGIDIYRKRLVQTGMPERRAALISSYLVNAHVGMVLDWLQQPVDQTDTSEQMAVLVTKMSTAALVSQHVNMKEIWRQ